MILSAATWPPCCGTAATGTRPTQKGGVCVCTYNGNHACTYRGVRYGRWGVRTKPNTKIWRPAVVTARAPQLKACARARQRKHTSTNQTNQMGPREHGCRRRSQSERRVGARAGVATPARCSLEILLPRQPRWASTEGKARRLALSMQVKRGCSRRVARRGGGGVPGHSPILMRPRCARSLWRRCSCSRLHRWGAPLQWSAWRSRSGATGCWTPRRHPPRRRPPRPAAAPAAARAAAAARP